MALAQVKPIPKATKTTISPDYISTPITLNNTAFPIKLSTYFSTFRDCLPVLL